MFKLTTESGAEDHLGVNLGRYIMQETRGDVTSYQLRPPAPGVYTFTIFAKECTPVVPGVKEESTSFTGVCIFRLECVQKGTNAPTVRPFPPCSASRYGATERASKYGMIPTQNGFVLKTVKGKAELRFK